MSGRLRAVMRNFATGVCVASTYRDEGTLRRHDAITINSLTSVSLDPALISICLQNRSNFLADLLATGKWALSILEGDEDVTAARLAKPRQIRSHAVAALAASPGAHSGALILDEHASIECELWDSFDVGDHKMVIGKVLSINLTAQERPPLAFLHGRYRSLQTRGAPVAERPELAAALAAPFPTAASGARTAGAFRGVTR